MKRDCKLCQKWGRSCHHHPEPSPSETVTGVDLGPTEIVAVECLIARGANETMESVAKRAGLSVRTLYRYLQKPEFVHEYKRRVEDELGAARQRVARALIEGACKPGSGQGAMQRIFWQRLGELVDRGEVSGPDGEPVAIQHSGTPMESILAELSPAARVELLGAMERAGGEVPKAPPTPTPRRGKVAAMPRRGTSKTVNESRDSTDTRSRPGPGTPVVARTPETETPEPKPDLDITAEPEPGLAEDETLVAEY